MFLSRLVFTVVSDPPDEDEEGDCVDVAYASVDFIQVSVLTDVHQQQKPRVQNQLQIETGFFCLFVCLYFCCCFCYVSSLSDYPRAD